MRPIRLYIKLVLRRFWLIPSFCKKCGRDVRDFVVPDTVWEKVEALIPHGSVLCYECFCDVCEEAGLPSVWELWLGGRDTIRPPESGTTCNRQTIYVVTAGEYSDYRIEAVFDDREKAEEFEAAYDSWGTGCRIEEYELNPPAPPAAREGYSTYRVTMDRDGNVLECVNWGGKRPSSDFMTYDNNLVVEVTATDEQHAAKIANERRVQFIAGNRWPGK